MWLHHNSNKLEVHFPVCCRFRDKAGNSLAVLGLAHNLSLSDRWVGSAIPPSLIPLTHLDYAPPQPLSPIDAPGEMGQKRQVKPQCKSFAELANLITMPVADFPAIIGELEVDSPAWLPAYRAN